MGEFGLFLRILHICSWNSSFSGMFLILAQGCGWWFSGWQRKVYTFLRSVFSSHAYLTVLRLAVSPSHDGRTVVAPQWRWRPEAGHWNSQSNFCDSWNTLQPNCSHGKGWWLNMFNDMVKYVSTLSSGICAFLLAYS